MPALTRTLVRAAAGLLALSALTACTTSQEDQQGPEERSTPLGSEPSPAATVTPSAPDEYPDESGYPSAPAVATPGAAQLTALVTALTSVDPALAADPARVAQQAQETCQDIADGKSDTQLVGNVTSRFTVPGGPEVTTEQGQTILDAARSACGG